MNPFTTEHPLASKASWFDTREHPKLSFVCSTVALALIITPFVLYRLYLYAISDIGAEPNPFPQPLGALVSGSVFAFVLSLIVAVPVVFVFRWVVRRWRTR